MTALPDTTRRSTFAQTGEISGPTRWLSLLAICLGVITVFFNITATFTDLTSLQSALHVSSSELIWVTSAYSLVLASFVLTGGTVGDLIGRKPLFLIGTLVIVGGNLLIFFSATVVGAIAGQAIMGLGGAMILPTSLAIVSHTFANPHQRTQAIGFWAASSGVGMAVGPLAAGAVLQHSAWNTIYLAPAIASAFVFLLGIFFLHNSSNRSRHLDIPGVVLATVTTTALVYGVIQGGHDGYGSAQIIGAFAVAVAAFIGFIVVESRASDPMMDLGLFRSRSYSSIMIIGVGSLFAFNALGLLLLFLFQRGQHTSPVDSGWRLLPLFAAFIITSALGARLVRAIGVKLTITVGLALLAVGSALMLRVTTATAFVDVWPILITLGAGLGLLLAPTTAAAMMSVQRERAGMASASVNMFRQLGGVLGASIIGTVLTSTFANKLAEQLASRNVPIAIATAVKSAAGSSRSAPATPGPIGDAISAAVSASLTAAIHNGFTITLIVAIVIAIPTLLFVPARPTPAL